ncbi:MAG TPA: fructose-6-phosphate aldolase [Candidatus Gracilibacteria bacterium]
MQIFLDSADLDLIKKYAAWGIVDGVTTNPTLIAKEGVDLETRIKAIAEVVDGPISAEVVSTEASDMIKEGRIISAWHKNVYVKVPMTSEGLKAVKVFSSEGIHTNVTLVFSVPQAMMAAKAGATLVSPFLGRVDDISYDGVGLVADIVTVFQTYGIGTQVLAASVRHPLHVVEVMKVGADIATIPPKLLDKLVTHPLTESGLAQFLKDWESCENCKSVL